MRLHQSMSARAPQDYYMFEPLSTIVSAVVMVAFPTVASYRALLTNDVALMRPWIMYWVVYTIATTIEAPLKPILGCLPFYGTLRAGALLYLVLPQTRGAVTIYTEYVEPFLRQHEGTIDSLFEGALRSAYTLFSSVAARIFRKQDGPPPPPPSTAQSYLESTLGAFRVPVQRSSIQAVLSGWTPHGRSREELQEERTQLQTLLSYLDRARNEADRDGYDIIDPGERR